MKQVSLQELERHLWEAAHIITGPIDASDYKTYIFPVLFFKRVCDVYDEEYAEAMETFSDEVMANAPEQHRMQVPDGCHWRDVIETTTDVGKSLKAAFIGIEKENPRLYGIFGDASWTNKERLPDHLLLQLLNHFNKLDLSVKNVRVDDMGRAYEYLIKRFADKANKKAGEFYTPRAVVRMMVNLADPQEGMKVYDPCSGSGGMLIMSNEYVEEHGGDPRNLGLFGQEDNGGSCDKYAAGEISFRRQPFEWIV